MIRRTRTLLAAAALVGAGAAIAATPALAVTAAPHWSIRSAASPTHFTPNDSAGHGVYTIILTNTGGADTDGSPVTITDDLPAGLTALPLDATTFVTLHASTPGFGVAGEQLCTAGPPVTCTENVVIHPGSQIIAFIPVSTASPADQGTTITNHVSVSGGGAPDASATEQTPVDATPSGLGLQYMETSLTDAAGAGVTQAGDHPYQFHFGFQLNTDEGSDGASNVPAATPRYITAKLPPGLVVNPRGTPVKCTEAEFQTHGNGPTDNCPFASAVGLAHTTIGALGSANPGLTQPVYNMVAPPGSPASLGFNAAGFGIFVHMLGGVDTAGDYALKADIKDIPQYGLVSGARVDLWGDPSDPGHDLRRGACANDAHGYIVTCPVTKTDTPFLTLPSACSDSLTASLSVASWEDPNNPISGSVQTLDSNGDPAGVTGCDALDFNPTLTARPTTNVADSPSGLDVDLNVPQTNSLDTLATSTLKKSVVTLPEGLVLNPSAANGLSACSSAQIGLTTPIGQVPIHFTAITPAAPTRQSSARCKSTPRCWMTRCRAPSTWQRPRTTPSAPS